MGGVPSPAERPKYVVFLRDFVDIDRSLTEVRDRFRGDGVWLVPLAERAADDEETRHVRLHLLSAGHRFGVPAKVSLGRCSKHGDTVLIPIRWEAATLSGLFPILDGNLELHPLDADTCRLGLSASYRPPLDAVGKWLDRMAFHQVAESTVRSFLGSVASHLSQEEPDQEDGDDTGSEALRRFG